MEAEKLQSFHDQLKSGQSRRGRKGGLGGVAGEGGGQKGSQTFFGEEGESPLYANFVKGKTLNATQESKCRVIFNASEASESDACPSRQEKKTRKAKSSRKAEAPSASESDAAAPAPASDAFPSKRKRRLSGARVPLIEVQVKGKKASVIEALREAAPDEASHVVVVGGCGLVGSVELAFGEGDSALRKLKKCRLCHVQGTLDLASSEGKSAPSLFGIFAPAPTAEGEASAVASQGSFSVLSLKPSKSSLLKLWGLPVVAGVSEG